MVVIVQSGCIRAKVIEFGQKWLYFGKSSCNRAKCLYLVKKVIVFGQKWLYSRKTGCIRS